MIDAQKGAQLLPIGLLEVRQQSANSINVVVRKGAIAKVDWIDEHDIGAGLVGPQLARNVQQTAQKRQTNGRLGGRRRVTLYY
jgi:hypothetical protein